MEARCRLSMFGLDDSIAGLGEGAGLALTLLVALLLGLRHATDPDHLTAVCTLAVSEDRRDAGGAGALGLAWGAGHALTLLALGLPVVLLQSSVPASLRRLAEAAVGAVIVALAVRLLRRWRRGYFHLHPHSHGHIRHAHPHFHETEAGHDAEHRHAHAHAERLGRTPAGAFGIGLVHGVGGSAGVGVLLVGSAASEAVAVVALLLFALGTALSMAAVTALFGHALSRQPLLRRLERLVPALGVVSLMFGCWYALGALEVVPYAV